MQSSLLIMVETTSRRMNNRITTNHRIREASSKRRSLRSRRQRIHRFRKKNRI